MRRSPWPLFALVGSLCLADVATGQDGPATPPVAAPQAADPEKVAGRMAELFSRAEGDLPTVDQKADAETRSAQIRRAESWKTAVEALATAADEYVKAAGDAPVARALFWGGYGKVRSANHNPDADAGLAARRAGVQILTKCLTIAAPDADFRADAEFWLGTAMTHLFDSGGGSPADAAGHLRVAAKAFLAAGRNDEAGQATTSALKVLTARGLLDEARAFVEAVGADRADFGVSSGTVRVLVAKVQTTVGAKFPDLGTTTDADGKPFVWKDLAGGPFVVHFFHAGWPTGRMAEERDVETTLRPLFDKLAPQGLRVVGVSMDSLLDEPTLEARRKYWDEAGLKGAPHDGSLAAVKRWVDTSGIAWPWLWTGKWMQDPVSIALGGAGQSAAHAILVDAAGVIRWRGDAPFTGLPEAAAGLMTK